MAQEFRISELVSIELIAIPFLGSQIEFIGKRIELKAIIRFRENSFDLLEEGHIGLGLKRGELMVTTVELEQPESQSPVIVINGVATSEVRKLHKKLFEAKQELILSGTREAPIGIFTKPCRVAATFEVCRISDLYPTRVGGLWPNNIRGNKLALLKKEALFHFIAPQLDSRLIVEAFYE